MKSIDTDLLDSLNFLLNFYETLMGDYSVAPTVQLSTTFLKRIPTEAIVRVEAEAVSAGKTTRPFKKFDTEK